MSNKEFEKLFEELEYMQNNPRSVSATSLQKEAGPIDWMKSKYYGPEYVKLQNIKKLLDKINDPKLPRTLSQKQNLWKQIEQNMKAIDSGNSPDIKEILKKLKNSNPKLQNITKTIQETDPQRIRRDRKLKGKNKPAEEVFNKIKSKIPKGKGDDVRKYLTKLKPSRLKHLLRLSVPGILTAIAEELGWRAFEYLQEKSQQEDINTLTSDPAKQIARLFQRNNRPLSPEKSLALVERFNKIVDYHLRNRKHYPEDQYPLSVLQEIAIKKIAKEQGLKYYESQPQAKKEQAPTNKQEDAKVKKPQAITYVVKAGDSLSLIAKNYNKENNTNITWQDIFQANKDTISHPDRIQVGQKITIPSQPTGARTPAGYWKEKAIERQQEPKQEESKRDEYRQEVRQEESKQEIPSINQLRQEMAREIVNDEEADQGKIQSVAQSLGEHLSSAASSGDLSDYYRQLYSIADPAQAKVHQYRIFREVLKNNASHLRTLLGNYLKQVTKRSFEQLELDQEQVRNMNLIFQGSGSAKNTRLLSQLDRLIEAQIDAEVQGWDRNQAYKESLKRR